VEKKEAVAEPVERWAARCGGGGAIASLVGGGEVFKLGFQGCRVGWGGAVRPGGGSRCGGDATGGRRAMSGQGARGDGPM
jgi:hypothetical protein